ncbi:MAG: hypothetical protein PHT07_21665 [Paludibacter sp.]|nr:hypothetical protein [Paludibacter sp.]
MKNLINKIRKFFQNEAAYYRLMRGMYEDLKKIGDLRPRNQTFVQFLKVGIRLRLIRKYRLYAIFLTKKIHVQSAISEAVYEWFYRNAAKLPGRKVYGIRFSRDCDMYESNWRVSFKNWFDYQYALMHMYDDAEGSQSITVITKSEYDEFQPSHRDRIMEAYENGNGSSIYV